MPWGETSLWEICGAQLGSCHSTGLGNNCSQEWGKESWGAAAVAVWGGWGGFTAGSPGRSCEVDGGWASHASAGRSEGMWTETEEESAGREQGGQAQSPSVLWQPRKPLSM